MAQKPVDRVEIKDFPGLKTNADPDDIPPGSARVQNNVSSAKPLALEVRPGFKPVVFEDQT